ncbi:MAG: S24/S26 family peptidase [Oscillospiraceae bacterium]|nr:S24/S26 family peptidase [Oscillospiraceae bacterium]
MKNEKSSVMHNVLTVFGTVMCVILLPILIINLILIVKSYTNANEVPSVGGVFPLIVLTDSMYPEIESGDLIICNTAEPE